MAIVTPSLVALGAAAACSDPVSTAPVADASEDRAPPSVQDASRSATQPDAASDAPSPADGGADAQAAARPVVSNVWPPKNFVGAAVLVAGKNFEAVTGATIGGRPASLSVVESESAFLAKLMITVPDAGASADAGLVLVTDGGASVPVPFEVLSPSGSIATPYAPLKPSPDTIAYPPISNTWHDECAGGSDSDLFRKASDDGNVILFTTDSGSVGYYERATRLFHLAVNTGDFPYPSYVGVYSKSAIPSSARLVLFPTDRPGGQRVLFVCFGSSQLDCLNDEEGQPLSDAGPACN